MTRVVCFFLVVGFFFQFTPPLAQAQIPVFRNFEMMGQERTQALLAHQTINVLVWNIHKTSNPQWFVDTKNLIANKDFVIFQEAIYSEQVLDFLLELGPLEWGMATSFRWIHKDLPRTGVTTASKYRSSTQDVLTTIFEEPVSNTPKVSLYTTYPIANEAPSLLLVANVHAINFVNGGAFLTELKRIEQRLATHNGPIILGGDFNTWSATRLRHLETMAKRQHLVAVPFTDRERRITLGHPLDHVFYRGVTFLKTEDLSSINSSDHLPLSVQFQL